MSAATRCASCGALVTAGADWCGQCYEPIAGRAAPSANGNHEDLRDPDFPGSAEPGGDASAEPQSQPAWPCPACGTRNPLALDACAACGTPFAQLFAEVAARPSIEPSRAARLSLVFPGLGHMKLGRRLEGVARAVMFAWTIGIGALLLLSRPSTGGGGMALPLALVFLAAGAGLYGLTAVDASREAAGDGPVLRPRTLLYGNAFLVILSVASLLVLVTNAASRVGPGSTPPVGPIQ